MRRHDMQTLTRGTVSSLDLNEGFGFIQSDEGIEVYFTAADLSEGDLASYRVGMPVRFEEVEGDHGFMAVGVRRDDAS